MSLSGSVRPFSHEVTWQPVNVGLPHWVSSALLCLHIFLPLPPPSPARPPPLHPRMTQNLPRRHHLAISQNHGTQWITVCAPSDTHVQAAVRGPKMTAPALGDRLNFSVHVCVHPQGSLCTCKCSYIAINMYGNICGDFVNKTWEQLMQVLYLDITRL